MSRRTLLRELADFNDRIGRVVDDVEAGDVQTLRVDLVRLGEDFDAFVIAYEEGRL